MNGSDEMEAHNPRAFEAELLKRNVQSSFSSSRQRLGLVAQIASEAEADANDASKVCFGARRSQMRRACTGAAAVALVVLLAAVVGSLAVQEMAVDASVLLEEAGLARGALALATLALVGCFLSGLLIAKRLTDCSSELRARRDCDQTIRGHYTRVIGCKTAGKILYLVLLGAIYWSFHQRQIDAEDLIRNVASSHGPLHLGLGSETNAPRVFTDPAEPSDPSNPTEARFRVGSRDPLYLIDLLLHGLVLFGMQGTSFRGLNWRLALADVSRRRRKLAKVTTELTHVANEVVRRLAAEPVLLNDFTEQEKALINRIYGRTVIEVDTESAELPPERPSTAVDSIDARKNGSSIPRFSPF